MIQTEAPRDLEAMIDTAADILCGPEFAAILTEIFASKPTQIPLRLPHPDHVYTEEIEQPGGYPSCEFMAVNEDADLLNVGSFDLSEISVIWTVNGDNELIMGRELKRLMRASKEAFQQTYFTLLPGAGGGSCWPGRVDYGPAVAGRPTEGQSSRWIKSASLQLFWRAIGG